MQQPLLHGCFLWAWLGSVCQGAAEDALGRVEGQPCPCMCPLSPAPARVDWPGQEFGVPKASMATGPCCRDGCEHP